MVEAWTGVMFVKFMVETASTIHGDSEGLRESQAREDALFFEGVPLSGAIRRERRKGVNRNYESKWQIGGRRCRAG